MRAKGFTFADVVALQTLSAMTHVVSRAERRRKDRIYQQRKRAYVKAAGFTPAGKVIRPIQEAR